MKKTIKLLGLCLAVVSMVFLLAACACTPQQQSSSASSAASASSVSASSASAASSSGASASSAASSEAAPAQDPTTKTFYALFLGNDTRYGTASDKGNIPEDDPCRADTIMLARVDPANLKVSLLSIPRDTLCIFQGNPEKINANHYFGPEGMVRAVEELTGAHIDYYFDERFIDFGEMVDALSGVDANVPINMEGKDIIGGSMVYLYAGDDQHLNSAEALYLVRQRYQYAEDGEANRQVCARDVVQRAITAAASSDLDAAFYANLIDRVCVTNIDPALLTGIIGHFMGHANEIQFQLGTGPYKGEMNEDETLWAVPRDEQAYTKLISMMEKGGDLTTLVPLPPAERA